MSELKALLEKKLRELELARRYERKMQLMESNFDEILANRNNDIERLKAKNEAYEKAVEIVKLKSPVSNVPDAKGLEPEICMTFADLRESFLKGQVHAGLGKSAKYKSLSYTAFWAEVFPDTYVHRIKKSELNDVYNLLPELPSNKGAKLSACERLEVARRGEAENKLQRDGVNNAILALNRLLKEAWRLGALNTQPQVFEKIPRPTGMEKAMAKAAGKPLTKEQKIFTDDEVSKIFSPASLSDNLKWNSGFNKAVTSDRTAGEAVKIANREVSICKCWLMLIYFHTGARRSEIAKLSVHDIKEDDGIWYFDITVSEDLRVKTESSMRRVPIHPFLIESGFLKYVESRVKANDGYDWLFKWPMLGKSMADAFSKWFQGENEKVGYLDRVGIEVRGQGWLKTTHAVRHTVITKIIQAYRDRGESQIDAKLRAASIAGHYDDEDLASFLDRARVTTATYDNSVEPLERSLKIISKIRYRIHSESSGVASVYKRFTRN